MRKALEEKLYGPAQQTLNDFQTASRKVGEAAHAQTALLATLSAAVIVALFIAAVAVRRTV